MVGTNVTAIVQVPLAGMLEQVLVCAKPPVTVTVLTVIATLPVFVTVTACGPLVDPTAVLANAVMEGRNVPFVTYPLPERAMVWGLSGASSVRVNVPVTAPPTVGVTVT